MDVQCWAYAKSSWHITRVSRPLAVTRRRSLTVTRRRIRCAAGLLRQSEQKNDQLVPVRDRNINHSANMTSSNGHGAAGRARSAHGFIDRTKKPDFNRIIQKYSRLESPKAVGDSEHRVNTIATGADHVAFFVWAQVAPNRQLQGFRRHAIAHVHLHEATQLHHQPTAVAASVELPQLLAVLLDKVKPSTPVTRLWRCPECVAATWYALHAFSSHHDAARLSSNGLFSHTDAKPMSGFMQLLRNYCHQLGAANAHVRRHLRRCSCHGRGQQTFIQIKTCHYIQIN